MAADHQRRDEPDRVRLGRRADLHPVGRSAALDGITNPRIGVFALNGGTEAPVVDAAFDSFQVTPDAPAGTVDPSDEFTGSTLDKCRWDAITREDPTGYRVTEGALRIDVPNGDIYGTDNTGPKNFILQTAPSGDWTLETKVDGSLLNEQYQQAGLLVQADDDNYVKFDFIADNQAGQAVTRRIEFRSEVAGVVQNPQPEAGSLTSAVWHLRLARTGDTFTASYSADGTTWTALTTLTNSAVGATRRSDCSPSAPPRRRRRPPRSTTSGSARRWPTRPHR
ncbi:DUF1349 domain-containing protein [Micromonospora sp. M12]